MGENWGEDEREWEEGLDVNQNFSGRKHIDRKNDRGNVVL